MRASDIQMKPAPPCPSCGKPMRIHGGSIGLICCEYKLLYRAGGWVDEHGRHVKDDRLAGGRRRVDGLPVQ